MRRVLVLLLAVPVLVACGPPPATPALECDAPTLTELGYLTTGRWAWFTTTGGRARFSVRNPYDGSIDFTPDDRTIYVGDASTVPATGSDSRISNPVASVAVDPEHPGTMDLEAGSYWIAGYAAPTTMATCPGTTISGVVPAVGTVATTTPSPTPSSPSPQPTCATPGTVCS
jgi:hypothetical protein